MSPPPLLHLPLLLLLWSSSCSGRLLQLPLLLLLETGRPGPARPSCPLPGAFHCQATQRCVLSSQVCDGMDDCGDMSDEAPGCTPCNKTYVGGVGAGWYGLAVPRPRGDKLPFSCYLNIEASSLPGREERIQVTFLQFRLGRFESPHQAGCPDGGMVIREGRGQEAPPGSGSGSGQLCGAAGPGHRPTYLSSTPSLTLHLSLLQLWAGSQDQGFLFSLRYRILPHLKSSLADVSGFLGRLVPSTQCDYKLDNCSQRKCVVRSPHYPGLYPANLSCSFHVFVLPGEIPAGKQALVRVQQPRAGRVWLEGSRLEKYGQLDTSLGLGPECEAQGDSLTAYDGPGLPGSRPTAPLIHFCRGGTVPPIISSGPDMLLVFRSSPYSVPRASPFRVHGFELEVEIDFVDAQSEQYSPRDRSSGAPDCQFTFTSVSRRAGTVRSLGHGLPGNSSCSWSFQALPGEVVWLAFLSFRVVHHKPSIYRTEDCLQRLSLLDGPPYSGRNGSVLGAWCGPAPPLLCEQALATEGPAGRTGARPCRPGRESYVSSGRGLTLRQQLGASSVVERLEFEARYEFVSLVPGGRGEGEASCDREYRSTQAGGRFAALQDNALASPRDVFLFGRGGRRDLACRLSIVGAPGQRVQVKFSNISVGGRECRTVHDPVTGRYRCHWGGAARAGVLVTEVAGEEEADMQCHCSVLHSSSVASTSHRLELRLLAEGMGPDQDYRDFGLTATFRFVPSSCTDSTVARGGGRVTLDPASREQALCDRRAWGLLLPPGLTLHLTLPGLLLAQGASCPSRARLLARLGGRVHVVCPDGPGSVSLSANSSTAGGDKGLLTASVQLTGGLGRLSFSWLRLRPLAPPSALRLQGTGEEHSAKCETPCPALGGCVEPALWCDGEEDCPSGWDESEINCSHLLIPLHYLYLAAGSVLLACVGLTLLLLCRLPACRRRAHPPGPSGHNGTAEPAKRVSNGTVETMLNHKDVEVS